jgi:hypothetical protein
MNQTSNHGRTPLALHLHQQIGGINRIALAKKVLSNSCFDSIWDDSNLKKHPTTILLVNGAFVFGEGLSG